MRIVISTVILGTLLISCSEDETQVFGCTDVVAENYNSLATDDDGTCTYAPVTPNEYPINLYTTFPIAEGEVGLQISADNGLTWVDYGVLGSNSCPDNSTIPYILKKDSTYIAKSTVLTGLEVGKWSSVQFDFVPKPNNPEILWLTNIDWNDWNWSTTTGNAMDIQINVCGFDSNEKSTVDFRSWP